MTDFCCADDRFDYYIFYSIYEYQYALQVFDVLSLMFKIFSFCKCISSTQYISNLFSFQASFRYAYPISRLDGKYKQSWAWIAFIASRKWGNQAKCILSKASCSHCCSGLIMFLCHFFYSDSWIFVKVIGTNDLGSCWNIPFCPINTTVKSMDCSFALVGD